jgi:hypothetical protein
MSCPLYSLRDIGHYPSCTIAKKKLKNIKDKGRIEHTLREASAETHMPPYQVSDKPDNVAPVKVRKSATLAKEKEASS